MKYISVAFPNLKSFINSKNLFLKMVLRKRNIWDKIQVLQQMRVQDELYFEIRLEGYGANPREIELKKCH